MTRSSRVSTQACEAVLRAIATERIESRYMRDEDIWVRSGYSLSYTRQVIRELVRRGWVIVSAGNRPRTRAFQITEEGQKLLYP